MKNYWKDIWSLYKYWMIVVITIFLIIVTLITISPSFALFSNRMGYLTGKINESTKYETVKHVEDTCRAMISSYESDRLIYEQYKDSPSEYRYDWGQQAKMRANKTAAEYNNYILENRFVWKKNVPDDIRERLEYLE